MSFPSAPVFFKISRNAEEALFSAIQQDTPFGYRALAKISELVFMSHPDPLRCLQESLTTFGNTKNVHSLGSAVLQCEKRGQGLKVDFDPESVIGRQLLRICGTDAARPLVTKRLGIELGFANCCTTLVSLDPKDVKFTTEEQIHWQISANC